MKACRLESDEARVQLLWWCVFKNEKLTEIVTALTTVADFRNTLQDDVCSRMKNWKQKSVDRTNDEKWLWTTKNDEKNAYAQKSVDRNERTKRTNETNDEKKKKLISHLPVLPKTSVKVEPLKFIPQFLILPYQLMNSHIVFTMKSVETDLKT